jgi:hypothetical protein
VITGLPTAPLASRLTNQRAAAPRITLPRKAPLIDNKILSKHMGPALLTNRSPMAGLGRIKTAQANRKKQQLEIGILRAACLAYINHESRTPPIFSFNRN